MTFRFEVEVCLLNEYGERVMSTTPASVLADNAQEAIEKSRSVFGAKYDTFRKFWSHQVRIISVTEADTILSKATQTESEAGK